MLAPVAMTETRPGPSDPMALHPKPATRTGWWLPVTALVVWLGYRQIDGGTAVEIALVGAAIFIAVFGLSVARAAAHRWWGGTLRVAPPPR